MGNRRNKTDFALIAAGFLFAVLVFSVVTLVQQAKIFELEISSVFTITYVISCVTLLFFALALVFKNKIAVLCAVIIRIVYLVYRLIAFFSIYNLFLFLTYIVFVLLLVLSKRQSKLVKNIWFVAWVLFLFGAVYNWFFHGFFHNLAGAWKSIFFDVIEVTGYFMASLWLRSEAYSVHSNPYVNRREDIPLTIADQYAGMKRESTGSSFCGHCGKHIQGMPKYCPFCGATIQNRAVLAPTASVEIKGSDIQPAQSQYEQKPAENMQTPTSVLGWIGWMLLASILPLIGLVIMVISAKNDSTKNYAKALLTLVAIAAVILLLFYATGVELIRGLF